MTDRQENNQPLPTYDFLLLIGGCLVSVVALIYVLHLSSFGLDLTDEGFYLNWIANPSIYKSSATQFGFIYHPLYQLAGENVAFLRQINILITFGLGWALCFVTLRRFSPPPKDGTRSNRIHFHELGVAMILSTGSLLFLDVWLPTPNYNTLALQSLMVAITGLILANKTRSLSSAVGWSLLGIGGWLAFMAKPTTAIALAMIAVVYLTLTGKLKSPLILIALCVAAGLTGISAWIIDGSIDGFILRLQTGASDGALLSAGHSFGQIIRWDQFPLSQAERPAFFVVGAFIALLIYLSWTNSRYSVIAWTTLVLLILATAVGLLSPLYPLVLTSAPFQNWQILLVWAIPTGAVVATAIIMRKDIIESQARDYWVTAALFLAMPYVYAFGTANNYWSAGAKSAIFCALAALAFMQKTVATPKNLRAPFSVGIFVLLFTIVIVHGSVLRPYRQAQPLHSQTEAIEIGRSGNELIVSTQLAKYVQELRIMAKENGFKDGDPVIDMTGHYPGAIFLLGAKPIGLAWMIGGNVGSNRLAIAALDRIDCDELARAWILVSPNGPRKLDINILKRYMINAPGDFKIVGTLLSPIGEYRVNFEHQLLKPQRSLDEAKNSCEKRTTGKS